jgi:protein TonB
MVSPMTEADITAERTSVEDRLTVMLVLAGLFHLIIILGVSFAAPSPGTRGAVPTLEVLVVSEVLPESLQNDEARYLAQRTQQGAGNMDESSRSQIPTASNAPVDQPGEADGAGMQDAARSLAGGETEAVASTRGSGRLHFAADAEESLSLAPGAPRQLLAGVPTSLPSSEDDPELSLKGPARRELLVTASTRQSDVAVYLDAWKSKVERVGTLNFPNQARRRGMSGSPVLEVALASDGRLRDVRVRRSSGHAELDQAAIDILRLAAPFEPFSPGLASRHDALRFAYEWQFVGGQLTGSTVEVPDGTR